MSLVDTTTGEIVDEVIPPMDAAEARRHVEKMRGSLAITAEQVLEAWQRQAFKPLGYKNWEAFLDGEFPDFGLNAVARNTLMVGLRNTGMSLRQIARTTGASRNTVAAQVAQIEPPETVVGGDGKQYPASQPERTSDDGGVSDSESSEPATPADSLPAPSSGHLEDPAGESSTGEDEGTAHDPSSPLLDKLLPDHTAGIDDASFQTELQKAVGQVRKALLTFDTDEVGLRADPENWEQLDLLLKSLGEWFTAVKAARPIGLRVINGEKR